MKTNTTLNDSFYASVASVLQLALTPENNRSMISTFFRNAGVRTVTKMLARYFSSQDETFDSVKFFEVAGYSCHHPNSYLNISKTWDNKIVEIGYSCSCGCEYKQRLIGR